VASFSASQNKNMPILCFQSNAGTSRETENSSSIHVTNQ